MRFDPGAINHFENTRFSRAVARKLAPPIDTMIAFGGQAIHSFRRAHSLIADGKLGRPRGPAALNERMLGAGGLEVEAVDAAATALAA